MKEESENDIKYISLLENQFSWINKNDNANKIIEIANKLSEKYSYDDLPDKIKERCVNFIKLEEFVKKEILTLVKR